MAEAEDVITDVARHATSAVQALWRRHRANTPAAAGITLIDVAPRLDLLISALFGVSYRLRTAQSPAPPTWLANTFQRHELPRTRGAIPATDGLSIWLPPTTGLADAAQALNRFRTVALQQAMRASRSGAAGAAAARQAGATPLLRDLFLLLEADAADAALARRLPGMVGALNNLRQAALAARPPLALFPLARRPLEAWVRRLLARACDAVVAGLAVSGSPAESLRMALGLAAEMAPEPALALRLGSQPVFKDWWTGEFRAPSAVPSAARDGPAAPDADPSGPTRSARLARRPDVRAANDGEDDARQGAWMIQPAAPHEQAEDPFGLQRPTDRDDQTGADEFAQSLADLAQARLLSTSGQPREVLLSDDPPAVRARRTTAAAARALTEPINRLDYPEWDYRLQGYRDPGATVCLLPSAQGPQRWLDKTLAEHRPMLQAIRRRFEMLRAQRTRQRRQLDGDELDLEACIDALADCRAGLPMAQALYSAERRARRDMAVLLLIDVSGSTDGWVSSHRRVIDVEREALLLVSIALAAMGQPYAVQAFSGQGRQSVTLRNVKRFDELYSTGVALRIAALEPEQYTRAGAAIRHASATLMGQPAAHRLLLLLSDGKPNDADGYEGRYGVEDMRMAVVEAKTQGIAPFCLTVDRQAASYLPAVFGAGQYALLTEPAMLPTVLLDWMQRLVLA